MKILKKEYTYIPFLLIVSIMPLIVYGKVDYLDYITYINWNGNIAEIDFFSYYKSIFTVLMTIIAYFLYIKNKNKFIKIDYIKEYNYLLILGILIVMSFLFSEYKNIAFKGFVFRYEGVIILISYILILYISINIFYEEKKIDKLIRCLLISYIAIAIIGIMQFLNIDIFKNFKVQNLIIPKNHKYLIGNLKLFSKKNEIVSSTIGNSNYVGHYYAFTTPLFLFLSIISQNKKNKYIYSIATLIGIIMLFLSSSETGIISCLLSILIFLILNLRNINKKNIKKIKIILMISIIIFSIDYINKGVIYNKIDELKYKFIYENSISKEKNLFQDILINKNNVSIKYKSKKISIKYKNNKLSFYDDKNNKLYLAENIGNREKIFYIPNEKYNDINIFFTKLGKLKTEAIVIELNRKIDIKLTIENNEFKYVNNAGKIIDPKEKVEVLFGNGKEELLTSRIFIWSRAIPKILKRPFLGYGPDTFETIFPNDDYIGLYKAYDTTNIIVDKPHNIYIQIASNLGIMTLIVCIIVIIRYIYRYNRFLKEYKGINLFSNKYRYHHAIFVAIISYLISGLMYDSTVAITPIFIIILGIGIRLLKNSDLEENNENT